MAATLVTYLKQENSSFAAATSKMEYTLCSMSDLLNKPTSLIFFLKNATKAPCQIIASLFPRLQQKPNTKNFSNHDP